MDTQNAINKAIIYIKTSRDNWKRTDLTKAFDSVSYEKLSALLNNIEFSLTMAYFPIYLNNIINKLKLNHVIGIILHPVI